MTAQPSDLQILKTRLVGREATQGLLNAVRDAGYTPLLMDHDDVVIDSDKSRLLLWIDEELTILAVENR